MKPEEYSTNTQKNLPLSRTMPNIDVLMIIGLTTIITLFNILSLFTPFAAYTTTTKLIVVTFGSIFLFILFFMLYRRLLISKIQELIQSLWKYLLIAVIFSTLIFLTTYAHSPLYPTIITIQIRTTSSMEFFQSYKSLSNNHIGYIYDYDQTVGDWNNIDGVFIFKDGEIGELTYEGMEFVNEGTQLFFTFIPQEKPTKAKILINESIYDVQVPSTQDITGNYNYSLTIPQFPPSTIVWHVWLAIFPIMRWLFLFIYFLFASVLIGLNNRKQLEVITRFLLLFIISFIFYNALLLQNKLVNYLTFDIFWVFIAISAFTIIPLLLIFCLRKYPKSKLWIILSIIIIAIGLRLYWIKMMPTAQVSDFGRFHQWALQLARGEGGLVIERHSTFTRLVGLIYKLFPSHKIIEMINVAFSLVTMFSIWQIGKTIHQEEAGIIGAYFFGIFPSQISMVTIVCADIIAVGLMSLSLLFVILFIKNIKYTFLLLGAIIYGFSVAIRSPLIAYSPVFLLTIFIIYKPRTPSKLFIRFILILIGITIGYLSVKGVSNTIKVDNMEIQERQSLYKTLLHGTNINYLGRNNPQDIALIQSWNENEIFQKVIQTAIQRIIKNPIGFISVLKHKYAYMFGNATYGASTAFLGEDMNFQTFETNWPYETVDIRGAFALLSQYSYIILLGLAALLPFTQLNKSEKTVITLGIVVILSALFFYTFFEVQPRYQRPIIPTVTFLASLSFSKIQNQFLK